MSFGRQGRSDASTTHASQPQLQDPDQNRVLHWVRFEVDTVRHELEAIGADPPVFSPRAFLTPMAALVRAAIIRRSRRAVVFMTASAISENGSSPLMPSTRPMAGLARLVAGSADSVHPPSLGFQILLKLVPLETRSEGGGADRQVRQVGWSSHCNVSYGTQGNLPFHDLAGQAPKGWAKAP